MPLQAHKSPHTGWRHEASAMAATLLYGRIWPAHGHLLRSPPASTLSGQIGPLSVYPTARMDSIVRRNTW